MKKAMQLFLLGLILTWLVIPSYYFIEINTTYKYILLKELTNIVAVILLYISFIGVILLILSIIILAILFIKQLVKDKDLVSYNIY